MWCEVSGRNDQEELRRCEIAEVKVCPNLLGFPEMCIPNTFAVPLFKSNIITVRVRVLNSINDAREPML